LLEGATAETDCGDRINSLRKSSVFFVGRSLSRTIRLSICRLILVRRSSSRAGLRRLRHTRIAGFY